jgi:hypothetical protein
VLAAQHVITPEAIPLMQWVYTLVLSLAGGAAASFTRYAGGASTEKWKLELARDFICSTLAGVLALFGALQFQVPPLLGAIAIALSGWGGSRFLEWAYALAAARPGLGRSAERGGRTMITLELLRARLPRLPARAPRAFRVTAQGGRANSPRSTRGRA